ncbi:MAG: putative membrane protein insertion efficiency factor [Gammaproteobacteria bacterium]|jgi:putative membrane protein insertion efficiency factor
MKQALIKLITMYQRFISPYSAPCCRFYPTCSEYMANALVEHGARKGLVLGVQRICRCHPFHEGGFDPVPQKIMKNN